ncbi:Calx-beta domain-containing protein [Coleofasciculus sp. B1-GNL1-01]|uniref:Calx-beta domain-containing protein n=1 Tax=Coleofasciculus sp. B1-GNL1-01 TaxID=3068484 RepID=UPI0040635D18
MKTAIIRLFATPMDGSDHIVELNPLTGAEINRFAAPDWVSEGSDGLAYDGNSLFFTNGFDSLWELNPDTGTVIDSDVIPGGMDAIDGLAALGGKVYLLDYQRKDIIEFDPNSDTVTNILNIDVINSGIDRVGGLGAMTNPNQLLVTNDQDTIFAIDPNTGVISDTFFTGTTNLLGGVAVVNNEIYVDSFMGDQTIDVLDQNGVFQRTISLPYDISALGGDDVGVSQRDLSYESNDTIAQALQSGLTGTNPGTFTDIGIIGDNPNHPESDVDVIAFQLNQGQRVTIDIDEVFDSRLDTALRLFNSTGEEVAFSITDLAPGESVWEPYIEFEAFHSDTYYVGISGADNLTYDPVVPNSGNGWGKTGAYQVTIDIDDNRGPDESNDTIFNAIATGLSSTTPGVFTDTAIIGDNGYPDNPTMAESDVDFYKVNLEAGERVTVDIDAWQVGSQLDAQLYLFDARGYDIAWSDNESAPGEVESGFDPYLDFTALESGTYYIGVSSSGNWYDPFVANSGSGYSTGGYNIKIGVGDYTEIPGTHTVTLNPGETQAKVDFRNRLVVPPEITVDDVTLTEGDNGSQYANFTVNLSDAYSEVVSVDYHTSDESAIAGEDYIATNGILTFDPGETTKTVNVEISGDTKIETDESLVLNLSNAINGAIADNQGTVTIENNDLPSLSIENISLTEGDSGITNAEFTVNLSQAFHETVTVDYTTADNSATVKRDYTAINGTLTFAPGQTSQTINVDVIGDTAFEDDETFALNLSNPNNAILDNSQGVATIVKDDFPTELNITTDEVTNSYALISYAGNQDKNALVDFTWDGNEDGTQSWGIKGFNNYSDTAGEWQSYQIRVGDFFTGQMNYLVLGNDHDVKNPNAASQFRNIQVYEQSATDEITGTDPSVGEVDTLTGTANVDTFILGDGTGALYADNGVDDYALIMDFDVSQDMIQLAGSAADYQLMATSGSLPEGTGIYRDLGTSDELIGIVQNVSSLSLESSTFSFV